MDRTDEELVRECLAGDTAAYAVLVKRYHRRVIEVGHRALRDGALAEDLAQEVFLRAYRSLTGFDDGRRFGPWLMAIAANRIRDHIKTRSRRGEVLWDVEPVTADDATPLERAAARQILARVEAGVATMPQETREVLRLRFMLGLDYEEVAEVLGMPLGTVKSRISRARTALRDVLAEWGDAEPAVGVRADVTRDGGKG